MTSSKTSDEYITQIANGSNLVDGRPTWEYAHEKKDDLDFMLRCCEAELTTMRTVSIVAAPYYFERAAILLRRAKQFQREVELCERYLHEIDTHYLTTSAGEVADIRKGPRYLAIARRISKRGKRSTYGEVASISRSEP